MSEPGSAAAAGVWAEALVQPDGEAELVVEGVSHRFSAASVADADAAVIEAIARRAAQEGRLIHLRIQDPGGEWFVTIHPDGTVEEASGASHEPRGRRQYADEGGPDAAAPTAPAPTVASPDTPPPDASHADTPPPDASPAHPPPPTDGSPITIPPRRSAAVPASSHPVDPPQDAPTITIPAVPTDFTTDDRTPPRTWQEPSPRPREDLPTLDDLLATRPRPPEGPAELGWQAYVRRLTGGLVAPSPGRAELRHRAAVRSVQRSLDGPKTVVVLNPKGGAHKTTATLMIAATFGTHRGGYTLAWDNNETRGTLGWRSAHGPHTNTAVNLLQDLGRFADARSARVGDLDNYVRSQPTAQFDVLASDEDAASAASIDAEAFSALHRTLARFYRVMVIDTGNNMRASNWQAAVDAADQLVIVSTIREDTAQSAAWAVDALRATGHDDAVRRAVTVLSAPAADVDPRLRARLHHHFGRLTRTVLDVPHDAALVSGGPLVVEELAPATREAWLNVTAAVAEGL
ncbi:chromosome partitioning protein [Cellulomonas fimi]|uniref:Chromosome partitioning protein n=1 Tax=Cellulomonas fimi TaxID=1708 RepID=A0A7Y0QHK6_CELFI|nr:chromosome partitioning protein [Cellulomonas fimi]NMR20385.1 chromosome partitioning protein [Cellulomonas fimi]